MSKRAALSLMVWVVASLPLYAIALDREGAIEAAKSQTKAKCGSRTPCRVDAKMENNKWFVRVEFPRQDTPQEKASPHTGGDPAFLICQNRQAPGRIGV